MAGQRDDPVVRSSRREAAVVLSLWFAAMMYTVVYSYLHGYGRDPESLTFILGFPDWVVWGILLPWGVCLLLSYWFGYVFVWDADLGPGADEAGNGGEDGHA